MSIIRTHDVTLYGGDGRRLILRPLSDEHLPLLYRWNADPEVLYWTEGGADIDRAYDPDTVRSIYGGVSQHALCFLMEIDAQPIGECWLQDMNLPEIAARSPGLDVRRIDMAIGEKAYWGRGFGTAFVGMLVEYAFCGEYVDLLHCFCEDYNPRSRRVWEKLGFTLAYSEPLPQPQKGKLQHHWTLTRGQFSASRRNPAPADRVFFAPLADLQPSQLWVSAGKLRLVQEWFNRGDVGCMDPIPLKRLDGRLVMTDGHTRAVCALQNGYAAAPCCWETMELDWSAYRTDLRWCAEAGVRSAADLTRRIIPHKEYERLWRKRCMEMTP